MPDSLTRPSQQRLRLAIPLPLWGVLASVLLWWLATTPVLHSSLVLHDFSPERAFAATLQLLTSGAIAPHIWASLRRVFVGLATATILGIPLGLLVGLSRPIEQSTSVLFQFVRMISPLSWMPIAVMAFGIGDMPVYFLLTIAAIWPLMLSTAAGVAAVDRRWLLLSRSLCATRGETVRKIIVPAIAPHILTGLRLAIGIIWIVLVPAEMLGVRAGLGYYILDTRDRLAYSELVAVILIIGLIGYLLDTGFRAASRAWHHEG
ncbi:MULTISPECIES: ABC transporter permease [unclassified Leptolyngbya]|uniref:ABC transporter permease n=1 Tax=unclassified Leptolyngbya TaxID=2650499 RepID=UPI001689D9F3|nr:MULTISPECIES: ABC transporter permease [unclassified Leptolyngbya]MBD1910015.1 ABC transporter permease [Leptolyngbya sp. FACHB-8]MBD2156837.1 ABC transporter permease [Leptolyngbya sp. FACHB-16]